MRVKLTDRFLKTHKPEGNEEIFDDAGPAGFGVRMGTNSSTFFVIYRRRTTDDEGNASSRKYRHTIGPYNPKGDDESTFTLAQARAKAERVRGNKLHPVAVARRAREVGTFQEVAQTFLADMPRAKKRASEPKLRHYTAITYKRQLENALIPHFGEDRFNAIDQNAVDDFFEKMAAKTPIHANRCFALMRRLYNWGIKKGYTTENPCHGLELPGGEEAPHEKDWTSDELSRVWKALDEEDPITRALFQMAFLTACRGGELLQAEWSWVDFEKELLRIPAKANKAGRKKEVVLTRQAVELLEALEKLTGHTGYLFPGREGTHLTPVTKQTARVAKRAEVSFRFHDIRDAVANYVGDLPGATVDTVKHILGHVTATGATKSYLRAKNLPDQRRALQKWADYIGRLAAGKKAKVVAFKR